MPTRALERSELPVDTLRAARFLIGEALVRTLPEGAGGGGRVVETEAYVVGDSAGYAYRGVRRRGQTHLLETGHAYIFVGHGVSLMLKVSTEKAGVGGGALIPAVEPLFGVGIMRRRRGVERRRDLTRRLGRLCGALAIDRELDGIELCKLGPLWVGIGADAVSRIVRSRRIGLTQGVEQMLPQLSPGQCPRQRTCSVELIRQVVL